MFKHLAIKNSIDRQKKIYQDLYKRYQHSHKALHWSSKEKQKKRFEVFLEIGNLNGRKILDLGCGFGDFLRVLQENNIRCRYTGYDIVEGFIKQAKKNFPTQNFELCTIFENTQRFDYIFSSGVFAFSNKTFFFETIQKALEFSRFGFGFNLYKPQNDERFFYMEKDEVLFFLKSLDLEKITVKEDYLQNDISFFLYNKESLV